MNAHRCWKYRLLKKELGPVHDLMKAFHARNSEENRQVIDVEVSFELF